MDVKGLRPLDVVAYGVLLRPWRDDDIDALWEALQDPEIRFWNGSGSGSYDDAVDFIRSRQDWSSGDHASWAVADPTTRALTGSVSLYAIDRVNAAAEIGYWTVAAARGRGVATAAVAAACDWAFVALELERIALRHAAANVGSARVAERAGFSFEGRSRRSYRYGDGQLHDELCWSRLRADPPPSALFV
ncbi:MAG: GNAT family N-acetyltransferase [Mycobacteriaceae bacterium]|nr:GNAT family N-acetyltransferase [Mycobacteriaceae bacterium]